MFTEIDSSVIGRTDTCETDTNKTATCETEASMSNAVLLASCQLKNGVAAAITQFAHQTNSNITDYDQYVDVATSRFYCRMEWPVTDIPTKHETINQHFFQSVAKPFNLDWKINYVNQPLKIAVFVSKEIAHFYTLITHCLTKQWNAEIVLMISNHESLRKEADRFDIPYYYLPVSKANKLEQEDHQLALLQEHNIDLIVLSRYMQILSSKIISPYKNRIINIHHSMLPAFTGARPYHQAYQRGVKLIGATSHYVTEELDAGPIIAQDVTSIGHRQTVEQMISRGRELETSVLSQAVGLHVDARIMVDGSRTILFR